MITISRGFRRVNVWTGALLVAGAVASCAPFSSSQQPVQSSNPTVTYNYRTDQELLQANQNTTTYCNQYQTIPRTTDESVKGGHSPTPWRYTSGRGTGDPVRRAGRAAESPAAQVARRAHHRRAVLVAPVPRFGRWGRQWVTSVWYARSACSPIARSRVRSVLRLSA
jgi:hypothetical protein